MAIALKINGRSQQKNVSRNMSVLSRVNEPITKTETFLVCLDNPWAEETAMENIINHISKLADEIEVKIFLLQVITETTQYRLGDGTVTTAPYSEEERQQISTKAGDYLNIIAQPLRDVGADVVTIVRINRDTLSEIADTAKEIDADYIVTFSHKKSWIGRLFHKNITDAVLQSELNIPIMLLAAE